VSKPQGQPVIHGAPNRLIYKGKARPLALAGNVRQFVQMENQPVAKSPQSRPFHETSLRHGKGLPAAGNGDNGRQNLCHALV